MSTPTPWKKILVPTDFSEDSLKAVREARRFQQLTQAEVVLLHVSEPAFTGLRIHTEDIHDQMQAAARRELEALVSAHFGGSSSVTTLVKDGRAGDMICGLARTVKADAIFIATHGITAMKHFMLGSVAEKVVRHAPCSVLVVRRRLSRHLLQHAHFHSSPAGRCGIGVVRRLALCRWRGGAGKMGALAGGGDRGDGGCVWHVVA